jgi:hypothetical protein
VILIPSTAFPASASNIRQLIPCQSRRGPSPRLSRLDLESKLDKMSVPVNKFARRVDDLLAGETGGFTEDGLHSLPGHGVGDHGPGARAEEGADGKLKLRDDVLVLLGVPISSRDNHAATRA